MLRMKPWTLLGAAGMLALAGCADMSMMGGSGGEMSFNPFSFEKNTLQL